MGNGIPHLIDLEKLEKTMKTGKAENVLKTFRLPVEVEETTVRGALECGFKQEWISGENGDVNVDMTCGAGCDNPYLQITVEELGQPKRYFRCDMGKFLQQFVEDEFAQEHEYRIIEKETQTKNR